jgi:hypothetical protein
MMGKPQVRMPGKIEEMHGVVEAIGVCWERMCVSEIT